MIQTPKEKAKELVDKFINFDCDDDYESFPSSISSIEAKQCAIICVDEILIVIENERVFESIEYWEEVKKEIELL